MTFLINFDNALMFKLCNKKRNMQDRNRTEEKKTNGNAEKIFLLLITQLMR